MPTSPKAGQACTLSTVHRVSGSRQASMIFAPPGFIRYSQIALLQAPLKQSCPAPYPIGRIFPALTASACPRAHPQYYRRVNGTRSCPKTKKNCRRPFLRMAAWCAPRPVCQHGRDALIVRLRLGPVQTCFRPVPGCHGFGVSGRDLSAKAWRRVRPGAALVLKSRPTSCRACLLTIPQTTSASGKSSSRQEASL
jgi:hypothetical protein